MLTSTLVTELLLGPEQISDPSADRLGFGRCDAVRGANCGFVL